jgi:hypothetical protein
LELEFKKFHSGFEKLEFKIGRLAPILWSWAELGSVMAVTCGGARTIYLALETSDGQFEFPVPIIKL